MAQDALETLLRRSPLSDAQRADLWDAYESAPDADALTAALEALSIPNDVKASVWDLKANAAEAAPAGPKYQDTRAPSEQVAVSAEDFTGRPVPRSLTQDLVIGAGKGAANTAIGLGEIVAPALRHIPGVRRAVASPEQFDEARRVVAPSNTAQSVGHTAEQIGEFFLPVGAPAKLKTAAEVAKAGVLGTAQTGSVGQGAASAALTAVVPGAQAVRGISKRLETSAQKSMAQALGATKEWAKSEAAKLAPEMLKRGIKGSREAMLAHASEVTKRTAGNLNAAYKAAAEAGETVSGQIIQGNIQLAADALKVPDATGKLATIPGTERVIAQLDRLAKFVATLGDDIPVDRAAKIKRVWDRVVSKAGLFGHKAGASATDSADAWAIREGAGSFRQLLNTNPTIEALNAELSFWAGLKSVLKATALRTQAQGYGLVQAGGSIAGATVGATSGEGAMDSAVRGAMGALAGQQFIRLMQSPAWRTQVSAPLKHMLAEALASGSAEKIADTVKRITAALPAQARPALAQ